jgi:acyl carrier protein
MSEMDVRLLRCFASVFPELSEAELRTVTIDSAGHWDSLSTVTLAALVQEEFNIEIEPETIQQLTSFEAFRTHLQKVDPDRSGSR